MAAARLPPVASNPFASMHGIFHSAAFLLVRNVVLFFVVVFWLSLAYWVYKDARRRIDDPWLVGAATVLGLFPPFAGPLVYLLFRPVEYLADVRVRELELQELDALLGRRLECPVCRTRSDGDFLVCPVCHSRLRQACRGCGAALDTGWQMCPWCETPAAGTASGERGPAAPVGGALDARLRQEAQSAAAPARRRTAERPAQA